MKLKALLVAAPLLATPAFAQTQGNIGPGAPPPSASGGGVAISGTPAAANEAVFTNSTTVKGVSQGVFNVRLMYGAAPDGSTNNATAISNAFAASNAFTAGAPTVYFDCDTEASVCEYNYGGSGTSPINPTIATTILCAPGATLNYTGTAHAADIGPSGLSAAQGKRYAIRGCIWTGGASETAGLYFSNFITTVSIVSNEFISFGSPTTYSVVLPGNNWDFSITDNVWHDLDGTVRGVLDAHTATNANIHFINNKIDCLTSFGGACAIPTLGQGVGLWVGSCQCISNQILAHYPAIRISSVASSGTGDTIAFNQLEGNTNGTSPAITFGDPGGPAAHIINPWKIVYNNFYWPTTGNVSWIGQEIPVSGSYALDNATFVGNFFLLTPNGTTPYIATGSTGAYVADNTNLFGVVDQTTTTPLLTPGVVANFSYFGVDAQAGDGTSAANAVTMADGTGYHVSAASFHGIAAPMICSDVSGSAAAQSCSTTPKFTTTGSTFTPAAGDTITYKTTTTNTGVLTLNVNSQGAKAVQSTGGTAPLTAGAIIAGGYYLMTYDGTNWDLH